MMIPQYHIIIPPVSLLSSPLYNALARPGRARQRTNGLGPDRSINVLAARKKRRDEEEKSVADVLPTFLPARMERREGKTWRGDYDGPGPLRKQPLPTESDAPIPPTMSIDDERKRKAKSKRKGSIRGGSGLPHLPAILALAKNAQLGTGL